MIWSIFSYAYLPSVYLLDEVSVQIFYPPFNWLFSYCWVLKVLCMFWIQVLHQISVLQRFFPSLFILITVLCKEVVHFNKIKHQYFSFIDDTSVSISQKSLSNPKSPRFFIVQKFYSSSYTFRSMTHSNFCEG